MLDGLSADEVLVRLSWEDWLSVNPAYADVAFSQHEVSTRYARNGYEWDIHGCLYTPAKEAHPGLAFVFFHGGADSESVFDLTPDGRPGQARVLAAQGFTVLSITYPGHYPPGGVWRKPIPERQPIYLLNQELPLEETLDRNLKCTFNTIMQGAGQLVAQELPGRDLLAWGHSTGGPMAAALQQWAKGNKVVGLTNFGTGGPDGWRKAWREETGAEEYKELPVDHVSRRSPHTYRDAGYEDPPDLTPWGGPKNCLHGRRRSIVRRSRRRSATTSIAALCQCLKSTRRAPDCRYRICRSSGGPGPGVAAIHFSAGACRRQRQGPLGAWQGDRAETRNLHGAALSQSESPQQPCRPHPPLRALRFHGGAQ